MRGLVNSAVQRDNVSRLGSEFWRRSWNGLSPEADVVLSAWPYIDGFTWPTVSRAGGATNVGSVDPIGRPRRVLDGVRSAPSLPRVAGARRAARRLLELQPQARFLAATATLLVGCGGGGGAGLMPLLTGPWKNHCGPVKTAGQYCSYLEECAKGLYCDLGKKACAGPLKAIGAPCIYAGSCTKGLYCKPGAALAECFSMMCGADGVCSTGAALGKTCSDAPDACGPKALCVNTSTSAGSCQPLPALGQPCEGFGMCANDQVCSPADGKCVPPTQVGGGCAIKETCASGLVCLTASNEVADYTNPGTCKNNPLLPIGSPCIGAVCAAGAHCDYSQNKCAKDYAIGASCNQGNECGESPGVAADCAGGKCVATTKVGANCWPGPEQRCTGGMECVSEP